MLVHDIIRLNAKHREDAVALVIGTRRFTYAELQDELTAVARALVGAGVGPGDRVAVLGKNSLEYFLLYFALARIGAILVPMNFWHRSAEHAHTIADAEPRLLFVEAELRASLGADPEGIETLLLPYGSDGADWERFMAGAEGAELPAGPAPDDAHMILYTSGTTGRPKGAVLSHRRTVDDAFAMATALRVRQDDTFLNYFPPFHVGNWDHMKVFLLVGAKVVLQRQFDAVEVLTAIPQERVSVILGVPTMLHDLINQPALADTDTSSIRLVYYGAYDPSGIMQRTAEVFGAREGRVEMAHTFGMTEAGPFVTLCHPHEVFEHWGSVGKPIPGVEVELRDEDDRVVAPGEAGEICVRGPIMTGYWRNREASAETLRGGWLHTGDIATTDADGFLYIVDRKKDMIRSGGQNVYSKQIEDCLQEHPDVANAAVIGLPDPVYEEQVCAVVVLRDGVVGGPETEESLRAYVRSQLAGYNVPRVVKFVDELPRNAVGKIQKHLLRQEFGSMFGSSAHGGT